MTYIQDKLDGFHKIFTEYKNIKDGSMDSFFEKYVMIVLEESYNRGKTDYHNHIVEKVRDWFDSELENNKGDLKTYRNIHQDKNGILSLLQDTNPKE